MSFLRSRGFHKKKNVLCSLRNIQINGRSLRVEIINEKYDKTFFLSKALGLSGELPFGILELIDARDFHSSQL